MPDEPPKPARPAKLPPFLARQDGVVVIAGGNYPLAEKCLAPRCCDRAWVEANAELVGG